MASEQQHPGLRALGIEPIVVELAGALDDGRPPRVALRQLSPIEWQSTRKGMPVAAPPEVEAQKTREQKEQDDLENRLYLRDCVTRALVGLEQAYQNGDGGEWHRRWRPARLVPGTESANDFDLPMEWFDIIASADKGNLERCWKALWGDFKHRLFENVKEDNFRAGTDGALLADG